MPHCFKVPRLPSAAHPGPSLPTLRPVNVQEECGPTTHSALMCLRVLVARVESRDILYCMPLAMSDRFFTWPCPTDWSRGITDWSRTTGALRIRGWRSRHADSSSRRSCMTHCIIAPSNCHGVTLLGLLAGCSILSFQSLGPWLGMPSLPLLQYMGAADCVVRPLSSPGLPPPQASLLPRFLFYCTRRHH